MIVIRTENAPKPPAYFSQAVKSGGFVFVSGQGPFDPATGQVVGASIQEQTAQSLRNVSVRSKSFSVPVAANSLGPHIVP